MDILDKIKTLIQSSPTKHDPRGPSKHPMIMKCARYKSTFSDNENTRMGTFKHDLTNALYNKKITVEELQMINICPDGQEFKIEDQNHVLDALKMTYDLIDWLQAQTNAVHIMVLDETWVELPNLGIEGGTPDLVLIADFEHVLVADYKFGGTWVGARTAQIMSLHTGLVKQYANGRLFNAVIQPVLNDEPLVCEVDRLEVERHESTMKLMIEANKSDDAVATPCEYCGWCDYNLNCAAQTVALTMGKTKLESIQDIPNTVLSDWTKKAKKVKKVAGDLEAEVARRILSGQVVPGFYMGNGRKSRSWTDEEDAIKALKMICADRKINPTQLFKQSFVSVAQAEKIVGKSGAVREIMQTVVLTKQSNGTLREED